MKVFASDLDGVLADATDAIEERVREKFDLKGHPYKMESFYMYERFGLPKAEVDAFLFSEDCFDDPAVWYAAEPMQENIEEMTRWCLNGMVPSIITARPPFLRMVTEIWLAKNGVPYSNLLFGCGKNKGQMCYHIDAGFMVEDRFEEAWNVAEKGIKCYLIETPFNLMDKQKWDEGYDPVDNLLIWVKSFKEISELEGI